MPEQTASFPKMQFRQYPKLKNEAEHIARRLHDKFYATEKIHGANMSFIADGKDCLCACRTRVIPDSDPFYNYKPVAAEVQPKVQALLAELKKTEPDLQYIQVFGEYAGGCYDGKAAPGSKAVQRGVEYFPHNDFLVFDVLLNGKVFLDQKELVLAEEAGLKLAPLIASGTLQEMTSLSREFRTRVPDMFGLSPREGNLAEGLIVRPAGRIRYAEFGDVVFKQKLALFDESKSGRKSGRKSGQKSSLEALEPHLTRNRFANSLSKLGPSSIRKVVDNFVQDALLELPSAEPELAKSAKKLIMGKLGAQCHRNGVTLRDDASDIDLEMLKAALD